MEGAQVRLLHIAAVEERCGISRAQIYKLAARGEFPRPAKISERCARWPSTEIDEWIAARLAEREA